MSRDASELQAVANVYAEITDDVTPPLLVPHTSMMDDEELLDNQPRVSIERLGEILPPVSDETQVQIGGWWAGAVLGRRAQVQHVVDNLPPEPKGCCVIV